MSIIPSHVLVIKNSKCNRFLYSRLNFEEQKDVQVKIAGVSFVLWFTSSNNSAKCEMIFPLIKVDDENRIVVDENGSK